MGSVNGRWRFDFLFLGWGDFGGGVMACVCRMNSVRLELAGAGGMAVALRSLLCVVSVSQF